MPSQPTILTERLQLRPFIRADAGTVQRLAGDRAIAATTTNIPHPYEEGMAESWIAGHPESWRRGTGMICAIEVREEERLIGAAGLRIDLAQRNAELGYWIGTPWWNRGYATEAALAMVGYGFDKLGLQRIWARHFGSNPASGKVLSKLGMRKEGVLRRHVIKWGHFEDIVVFGMLADEFSP